jgi:hypothetical protein
MTEKGSYVWLQNRTKSPILHAKEDQQYPIGFCTVPLHPTSLNSRLSEQSVECTTIRLARPIQIDDAKPSTRQSVSSPALKFTPELAANAHLFAIPEPPYAPPILSLNHARSDNL